MLATALAAYQIVQATASAVPGCIASASIYSSAEVCQYGVCVSEKVVFSRNNIFNLTLTTHWSTNYNHTTVVLRVLANRTVLLQARSLPAQKLGLVRSVRPGYRWTIT